MSLASLPRLEQFLIKQHKGEINISNVVSELAIVLGEIKSQNKKFSAEGYTDLLKDYKKLAEEAYSKAYRQAEIIIKRTSERVAEVEAKIYEGKGNTHEQESLINALVERISTEIKLNPHNELSILEKYINNSENSAKAVMKGINDTKFNAGNFTNKFLTDAVSKSMSYEEKLFNAQKADEIEKIRAKGLSTSDYGNYLAISKIQQMGQLEFEVNNLVKAKTNNNL